MCKVRIDISDDTNNYIIRADEKEIDTLVIASSNTAVYDLAGMNDVDTSKWCNRPDPKVFHISSKIPLMYLLDWVNEVLKTKSISTKFYFADEFSYEKKFADDNARCIPVINHPWRTR